MDRCKPAKDQYLMVGVKGKKLRTLYQSLEKS